MINGHCSDSRVIEIGVPQESILKPLLFIIYVNDLPTCLNSSSVNMFADDTPFYYGSKNMDTLKEKLQDDLVNVCDWLNSNKLSLNIAKTTSIIICSKQKRRYLEDLFVVVLGVNGEILGQTKSTPYLEVKLDECLGFRHQLEMMVKFTFTLCMFKLSTLDNLNIQSVNQRIYYSKCILMWKINHEQATENLFSNFTLQSERPNDCSTRSMSKLDVYPGKAHPRSF